MDSTMSAATWADFLSTTAGALLSLALAYAPGLRARWAGLDGDRKRLVILGLLALAALGVFGLGCLGWWAELAGPAGDSPGGLACTQAGALRLARAFFLALMANQATYALLPAAAGGGADGR